MKIHRILLLGLFFVVPGLQAMDIANLYGWIKLDEPTTESIFHAVKLGDKTEAERWLKYDPGLVNAQLTRDPFPSEIRKGMKDARLYSGCTPTHFCAMFDKPELAELLLVRKADVDPKTHMLGRTPFTFAALFQSYGVAKILLDHKANIDSQSTDGSSPLGLAAGHGLAPMVQLLLSHNANINTQDQFGNTPLNAAARCGDSEQNVKCYQDCVKHLLLAGADWTHKTKSGKTALVCASQTPAVAKLLTIPEHGIMPAFLQTHLQPSFQQLCYRELGCGKRKKSTTSDHSGVVSDTSQALQAMPNSTSFKPSVRKLQPQPFGRTAPKIKTYVAQS